MSLSGLEFSCTTPVIVLDLKAGAAGDIVRSLTPYSRDLNSRLIRSSFAQTSFLAETPPAELERIASLPDASRCVMSRAAR